MHAQHHKGASLSRANQLMHIAIALSMFYDPASTASLRGATQPLLGCYPPQLQSLLTVVAHLQHIG